MSDNGAGQGVGPRGRRSTVGYRVEARDTFRGSRLPRRVGGVFLDGEWREIRYDRESPEGVPNRTWDPIAAERGVLTFEAAQALMSWSAASLDFHGLCVEFRLVQVRLVSEWTETEEGVSEPISFDRQRRDTEFTPRTPTESAVSTEEPTA